MAYLLLLFLLLSCQRTSSWKLEKTDSAETKFQSTRLCSKTKNVFHGLAFELLQLHGKLHGYINVFSQSLPSAKGGETKVTLSIGGETHQDTAHLLKGGQRLLLKEETVKLIVSSLSQGKSVLISLEGYEEEINPEKFSNYYETLVKPR